MARGRGRWARLSGIERVKWHTAKRDKRHIALAKDEVAEWEQDFEAAMAEVWSFMEKDEKLASAINYVLQAQRQLTLAHAKLARYEELDSMRRSGGTDPKDTQEAMLEIGARLHEALSQDEYEGETADLLAACVESMDQVFVPSWRSIERSKAGSA